MRYPREMATNKRRDFTQVALAVVQQAIGEVTPPALTKKQESGRRGGLKGGSERAAKLTPEQRSAIARAAATARWKK